MSCQVLASSPGSARDGGRDVGVDNGPL